MDGHASLAELYHENSKQRGYDRTFGLRAAAVAANPGFQRMTRRPGKRYDRAPVIALPAPATPGTSLDEVIRTRRSVRAFGSDPLDLPALATLLFAGAGVTDPAGGSHTGARDTRLRAAPSAGGLHATELYAAVRAVDGMAPGAYHYRTDEHVLEDLGGDRDTAGRLARASSYPEIVGGAAAVVVMTAVFGRTTLKYGERGYRFAVLEIGHVAQNILLAACALGLAAVPVGGFLDDDVHRVLDLDGVDEAAFYLLPVGHRPAATPAVNEWPDAAEAVAAITRMLWSGGAAQDAPS